MTRFFINDIWKLIKKFIFDYNLIKFISWKRKNKYFIKNIIPEIDINYIKISPFCKYISILDYSNGFNFNEVINNCKKKSLRKCCILSEPIMNNNYEFVYRFYHVTFYDINKIPKKYL